MKLSLALFMILALISTCTCQTEYIQYIEFEKLPACAKSCETLYSVAVKCRPTSSSSAASDAYHHCVCGAGLNQSSHLAGKLCKKECDNIATAEIKEYFQVLCALPKPPLTGPIDVVTSIVDTSPTAEPKAELTSPIEPPHETSNAVPSNKHISLKYWASASVIVILCLSLAAWAVFNRCQQHREPEGINRTIALDVISSPSHAHLRDEGKSDWPVCSFSINHLDARNPYGGSMASPVGRPVPSYSWQICADPPRSAGTGRSSEKKHGSEETF